MHNAKGLTSQSQISIKQLECMQTKNSKQEVNAFVQRTHVSWLRPNQWFRLEQEKSKAVKRNVACFPITVTFMAQSWPWSRLNALGIESAENILPPQFYQRYALIANLNLIYERYNKKIERLFYNICRIIHENKV